MKSIFLAILLACTFSANAQLDSIQVELTQAQIQDPGDSLQMVEVLNVNIVVFDIDFLGDLVVTIYEQQTNFPVQRLKYSKQELIDYGIISNQSYQNDFDLQFFDLEPTKSYRVEVSARNYQGAFLPVNSTLYEFL